jgi:uncharacterized membrane protein
VIFEPKQLVEEEESVQEAQTPLDPVWTFRGYKIRPSEFNTAMVHYYRAEVQRSNTWRTRLDTTTNWAVVTAGAAISFALSSPDHHYAVIILNTLLATLFLWIEARRYRYYELWSHRLRQMETDYFAAMLVPPFGPSPEWAENVAESLLQPEFPISMWEALGRRFRRNYMWIFLILAGAWLLKNFLHPLPATTMVEFIERSGLGTIPGWFMIAMGLFYNATLFLIGFLTAGLHQATGEVLPKWGSDVPILSHLWHSMEVGQNGSDPKRKLERTIHGLGRKRKQLMALIISDRPKALADRVLEELKRGVTCLHGTGMYTLQEREVLMVAVTVTEMQHLKSVVKAEDPQAFMIITPAQDVIGQGFQTLDA